MKFEIILTVGIKGLYELGKEEVQSDTSLIGSIFKSRKKGKKKEVQAVFKVTTDPGVAGFSPAYPLVLYVWNDQYVSHFSLVNGYISINNYCFVTTLNLYVSTDAKIRDVSSVDEAKIQLKEQIATRLKSKYAFEFVEIKVIDVEDSPNLSS